MTVHDRRLNRLISVIRDKLPGRDTPGIRLGRGRGIDAVVAFRQQALWSGTRPRRGRIRGRPRVVTDRRVSKPSGSWIVE